MMIPFKPSLLAMASVLALSACISGGGDAPAVKSSETPSNKVAPPPTVLIRQALLQVLIRQALLQVLIRQAPRQVGMAGILKQKYRLKIRKGKTRRQALMAECKMMRPNIMIMHRQTAHPTRSLKTTVICPAVPPEGRMSAIKIPMRRKMRNLKMVRKETLSAKAQGCR